MSFGPDPVLRIWVMSTGRPARAVARARAGRCTAPVSPMPGAASLLAAVAAGFSDQEKGPGDMAALRCCAAASGVMGRQLAHQVTTLVHPFPSACGCRALDALHPIPKRRDLATRVSSTPCSTASSSAQELPAFLCTFLPSPLSAPSSRASPPSPHLTPNLATPANPSPPGGQYGAPPPGPGYGQPQYGQPQGGYYPPPPQQSYQQPGQ